MRSWIKTFLILILYSFCYSVPQIKVKTGHSGYVGKAVYSPDGRYVLTAAWDKTLKLWDVGTGKELKTYNGHTKSVFSAAFLPDGAHFISAASDSTLKLWKTDSEKALRTFNGHKREVSSVAVSPDGSFAISGSTDCSVKLWDIKTGTEKRTFTGHKGWVSTVAISPDGKYIVSGGSDHFVILWEINSGREIWRYSDHGQEVYSAVFSPDGRNILASYYDGQVILFNALSGSKIKGMNAVASGSSITGSVSFSPDGKYFLTGLSNKTIKLYDADKWNEVKVFKGHSEGVYSTAFSPCGKFVLSGSWDKTARIWDIGTGKETKYLGGFSKPVTSVSVSKDGRYASSVSEDFKIRLWEITGGRCIKILTGHKDIVRSAVFIPDGKSLLSCSDDKTLKLWDIAGGEVIRTFTGHKSVVTSVSVTADGKKAFSGSWDKTARLWDLEKSEAIKIFDGHTSWINSAVISSDGKKAVTGSQDKIIKVWDVADAKETASVEEDGWVNSVAISPDRKLCLSGTLGSIIELLDIATGSVIKLFSGHRDRVTSVAFSNDGKYGLSGSFDSTLKLWEISSGREVRSFTGHSGWVHSAVFSNDSKDIFSGSEDGTIKIWSAATGKELCTMISGDDGSSLCWTPEGFFSGDEKLAREAVYVLDGMKVINIDQLFEKYYRPDIVAAKIAGEDITKYSKNSISEGVGQPPEVKISVIKVSGPNATVKVSAFDKGGGISGIRLYNNNKMIGENLRGIKITAIAGVFAQDYTVSLSAGENLLRAVAFSDDMTESAGITEIINYSAPELARPDMYVLAIGINEYKNPKYSLNYCVADMNGFVSKIRPGADKIFKNVVIKTISDKDATRENIVNAFQELREKSGPEDVFVFFYAGHGVALEISDPDGKIVSDFFYVLTNVTQMTDQNKVSSAGISGSEMRRFLADIRSTKQIMFIDACNSGAFADQFAQRGAAEENALAKLSRSTGSVIFASTTKEQFASEFQELKHGVFTFAVIEALDGKNSLPNGQLTAASVKAYIEDKIPEYSEKYKGQPQFPTTFMWGQDFPIGIK